MPPNPRWSADEAPNADATLRVIRLLFQALEQYASMDARNDLEKFRHNIQVLAEAVKANPSALELLATTGLALKTLEEYIQSTTRRIRQQATELQHLIATLTTVTKAIDMRPSRHAHSLAELGTLKLRMEQCIETLRHEAQKQKLEPSRSIEDLPLEDLPLPIPQPQDRHRSAPISRPDPVTGLPARMDAIAAIASAAASAKPTYVALLAVDGISLINLRFGYAAGDEVLNLYLDALRSRLPFTDRIFRWSGPAFLVLLERPEPLEKVRNEFRYLLPSRTETPIHAANRTTQVSISAIWTILPVAAPVEGLIEQLDKFLASRPAPY
jgi:GGDEF domain-containing protein